MNILTTILHHKVQEIQERETRIPRNQLELLATKAPHPKSLWQEMKQGQEFHLICEIKKASPSRGAIAPAVDVVEQARQYEAGGASAISVLTDHQFFQGTLKDLHMVKQNTTLPVLRKDFIISPYQVWEARAYGADIILLIAAALNATAIRQLTTLATDLGMDVLLELHDEADIRKIPLDRGKIILGINNRNLRNFIVSLDVSLNLKPFLPTGFPVISESGVSTPAACQQLQEAGFHGVLIGEAVMRASDPREFIQQLKKEVTRAHTA